MATLGAWTALVASTLIGAPASGAEPTASTQGSRPACPITERQLLGAWQRSSGAGFHEEMSFEADGTDRSFDAWLHQRPEVVGGTWSFQDCAVRIAHPTTPALAMRLRVVAYRKGRLSLQEEGPGAGGVTTYRRTGAAAAAARR